MERWKTYFQSSLNKDYKPSVEEENVAINEEQIPDEELTEEQVEDAIKGLKNCKAAGMDKIKAEINKKNGVGGEE